MIFGIETSTAQASLALVGPIRKSVTSDSVVQTEISVICEMKTSGSVRHSEAIFSIAFDMLNRFDLERRKVDGIAVSIGPGMFTALRVGLALAKGLAIVLKAPIVSINTLDALARSITTSISFLLPLIDASRGDVYAALYNNLNGIPVRKSPYLLTGPQEVDRLITDETLIFGPGLETFGRILHSKLKSTAVFAKKNILAPPASIIAKIGAEKLAIGKIDEPEDIEPFYIKEPDALAYRSKKTNRR